MQPKAKDAQMFLYGFKTLQERKKSCSSWERHAKFALLKLRDESDSSSKMVGESWNRLV